MVKSAMLYHTQEGTKAIFENVGAYHRRHHHLVSRHGIDVVIQAARQNNRHEHPNPIANESLERASNKEYKPH